MRRRSQPAATDPAHLLRNPDKVVYYRLRERAADWWAGRSDGRRDLAGLTFSDRRPTTSDTVYLTRLDHTRDERLQHETLTLRALTTELTIRHRALSRALRTAGTDLEQARADLETLLPTAPDPARRGPAETYTAPQTVADRRNREHTTAVLAPARARLATAQHTLARLTDDLAQTIATRRALARATATRHRRLTQHYARRTTTYQRAYTRQLTSPRSELESDPGDSTTRLRTITSH